MNQTIRESQAILHGLRLRTSLATAEMYQRIGRDEPVPAPRYNVVPRGSNTFEVVERSTGTAKGKRFGHDSACQLAQQLEDNANFFAARRKSMKKFSRRLLRSAAGAALMLIVFAYYGAGL